MDEKRFTKYQSRGDCHWQEEFGPFRRFNLIQHARYLATLKYVPDDCETILDWGSGDGALSYHLIKKCKKFIGTDTEQEGIDFFRKNLAQDLGKCDLILLSLDNPYTIDYPDASVDCIVCSDVIEHVLFPEKLLEEFKRLLKPGGRLVISTPYRLSETPNDPMHVHEFYPGEIKLLTEKYFDKVETHLFQKLLFKNLYNAEIIHRPLIRYFTNLLYKFFGYNPFMQDETTKKKWDFFGLIIVSATK